MDKIRHIPKINLDVPEKGYCSLLAHGFDWWEESHDVDFPMTSGLWETLKFYKEAAIERDPRKKTPIEFKFGGENMMLLPTGATGGYEFVLVCEDFRIQIASPLRSFCILWRATSAGLWSYGYKAIQECVYSVLSKAGIFSKEKRLVRADYAFDFQSDEFASEMRPEICHQIVCPSRSKIKGDFWVTDMQVETLTIGAGGTCTVQIYDKTKEIYECSGKDWMIDLWREGGLDCPLDKKPKNVWRVEIRVRGEWLKNRNMKDLDNFESNYHSVFTDALFNRRLTSKNQTDSNKRRWALHPIFTVAWETLGRKEILPPTGRKVTGKKNEVLCAIDSTLKGTFRTFAVLYTNGAYDEDEMMRFARNIVVSVIKDRDGVEKDEKILDRYEFIDQMH